MQYTKPLLYDRVGILKKQLPLLKMCFRLARSNRSKNSVHTVISLH